MAEFKPGDMVKLRCHPQEMMIQANTTEGLLCVWIDDYGQPHRETYADAVLEVVTDPNPLEKIPTRPPAEQENLEF